MVEITCKIASLTPPNYLRLEIDKKKETLCIDFGELTDDQLEKYIEDAVIQLRKHHTHRKDMLNVTDTVQRIDIDFGQVMETPEKPIRTLFRRCCGTKPDEPHRDTCLNRPPPQVAPQHRQCCKTHDQQPHEYTCPTK